MSDTTLKELQKKIMLLEAETKKLESELYEKKDSNSSVLEQKNIENSPEQLLNQNTIFIQENNITDAEKKVVLIGVVGTQAHIGVTHISIQIANILKNNNRQVALAEFNSSGAFDFLKKDSKSPVSDINFKFNNLDFYPHCDLIVLDKIFMGNYEFIVIDFGAFDHNCNKNLFLRCDIKIIISGSKPWELQSLDTIFTSVGQPESYHYCFNFTPDSMLHKIQTGMASLQNIYFLEYSSDPFVVTDSNLFPILSKYLLLPASKKNSIYFNKKKRRATKCI